MQILKLAKIICRYRILSSIIIMILTSLAFLTLFAFTNSGSHEALATVSTANSTSVNATGAPSQKISQQGLVTSSTDPLPGHETHQSAVILRLRDDNALYDGTLTFTASKPVEVQVLHRSLNSTVTSVPTEFGSINILPLPGNTGSVTISNIIPQYQEGGFVASLPFSGNAISLHNIDGEPFVASYSVAADIVTGVQRADDIGAAETPTEIQAITEDEAEPTEEEDSEDDNNVDEDEEDQNNDDTDEESDDGSGTDTDDITTPTPNP